jgi:hypothetical protein
MKNLTWIHRENCDKEENAGKIELPVKQTAEYYIITEGMPRPGFEPGTTASSGQRSPRLSYLGR